MLKQTYAQRAKQRYFYYKVGAIMMFMGFGLFALPFIAGSLSLYWGALFLTGSGTTSALWLSKVGWSRNLFLDFMLNQISALVIFLGIGVFLFKGTLNPVGILMTIIGLLLVGLGLHFHSPVTEDELDESNVL